MEKQWLPKRRGEEVNVPVVFNVVCAVRGVGFRVNEPVRGAGGDGKDTFDEESFCETRGQFSRRNEPGRFRGVRIQVIHLSLTGEVRFDAARIWLLATVGVSCARFTFTFYLCSIIRLLSNFHQEASTCMP